MNVPPFLCWNIYEGIKKQCFRQSRSFDCWFVPRVCWDTSCGITEQRECMESLVCSVESLDSFLLPSNKYIACLFSAVSSQICQPFVQDEREARHRKLSSAMEETTRNGSGECTAAQRDAYSLVPYKAQLDWFSLLVDRFVKFLASGIKSSQCRLSHRLSHRRFHRRSHRLFHHRPQHRPFERLEIT